MKKNTAKRKFLFDSVAVFFIAITPFLYKVYDYFPTTSSETTVSFLGLTIDSNGFADVSTHVWYLTIKIIPLALLLIWFFTSKDWWYHILLIPIAMYAFQLFENFFSEKDYIDTENIWWLIPICMVVIPFVYLIRIKLYDKYVNGIDLQAMEAELHSLKQKRLKKQNIEIKKADLPKVDYRSLSEWLNQELSTAKLAQRFQKLKHSIVNMSLFKF